MAASRSPLNRDLDIVARAIAYEPPTTKLVEDAEAGPGIEYQDRWATEIHTWLSSGRTLVSWCQQPNKPARSLVLSWLEHPDQRYDVLRDHVERGLKNYAWALVDEAGDIAREPLLIDGKGMYDPISMADKRQRVETALALAALRDPVKFSKTSKMIQQLNVQQVIVTRGNVGELTDEQLQQKILEVEKKLRDARAPGNIVSAPELLPPSGEGPR